MIKTQLALRYCPAILQNQVSCRFDHGFSLLHRQTRHSNTTYLVGMNNNSGVQQKIKHAKVNIWEADFIYNEVEITQFLKLFDTSKVSGP